MSILAYEAPVFDGAVSVVGALCVPFLQGSEASRMEEISSSPVIASGRGDDQRDQGRHVASTAAVRSLGETVLSLARSQASETEK